MEYKPDMTGAELEAAIVRVNHPRGLHHFAEYVEYAPNIVKAMIRGQYPVPDWFVGAMVTYARTWSWYEVRLCRRDGGVEEYKLLGRKMATAFLADHASDPNMTANAIRRLENG